jgi:hypothetical protein
MTETVKPVRALPLEPFLIHRLLLAGHTLGLHSPKPGRQVLLRQGYLSRKNWLLLDRESVT